MKKLALVLVLCVGGIAAADGSGSAAGSAAPTAGSAAPAAGSAAPAPAPAAGSAAPAPAPAPDLHQICVDAMNADPVFAKSIVLTADKQIDQQTIQAHLDAFHHIQKNERHVIYAYAAMWAIAALLVAFLFFRQRALKAELLALRHDLEQAAREAKA